MLFSKELLGFMNAARPDIHQSQLKSVEQIKGKGGEKERKKKVSVDFDWIKSKRVILINKT